MIELLIDDPHDPMNELIEEAFGEILDRPMTPQIVLSIKAKIAEVLSRAGTVGVSIDVTRHGQHELVIHHTPPRLPSAIKDPWP